MKKAILIRFAVIGAIHSFLYLWLVPFVIYPRFGHNGFIFAVTVAVLLSVSIIGTLFLGKKRNKFSEDADTGHKPANTNLI